VLKPDVHDDTTNSLKAAQPQLQMRINPPSRAKAPPASWTGKGSQSAPEQVAVSLRAATAPRSRHNKIRMWSSMGADPPAASMVPFSAADAGPATQSRATECAYASGEPAEPKTVNSGLVCCPPPSAADPNTAISDTNKASVFERADLEPAETAAAKAEHMTADGECESSAFLGGSQASAVAGEATSLAMFPTKTLPQSMRQDIASEPFGLEDIAVPTTLRSESPWANTCVVNDYGYVEVKLMRRGLDDDAVGRWCAWARSELPRLGAASRDRSGVSGQIEARRCLSLDFSGNAIGDDGVRALMRLLTVELQGVTLRTLHLHKNSLEPASAKLLSTLITALGAARRGYNGTPLELHLSHNRLGKEGIVELLEAVACAGHGGTIPAYPCQPRGRRCGWKVRPLWLRVECNGQPDVPAEEFLAEAGARLAPLRRSRGWLAEASSVPLLCPGDHAAGCSARRCVLQRGDEVPIAHVYCQAVIPDKAPPMRWPATPQRNGWRSSRWSAATSWLESSHGTDAEGEAPRPGERQSSGQPGNPTQVAAPREGIAWYSNRHDGGERGRSVTRPSRERSACSARPSRERSACSARRHSRERSVSGWGCEAPSDPVEARRAVDEVVSALVTDFRGQVSSPPAGPAAAPAEPPEPPEPGELPLPVGIFALPGPRTRTSGYQSLPGSPVADADKPASVNANLVVLSCVSLGKCYRNSCHSPEEERRSWDGLRKACRYYSSRGVCCLAVFSARFAGVIGIPHDIEARIVVAPEPCVLRLLLYRLAMELGCQYVDNMRPRIDDSYVASQPDIREWLRADGKRSRVEFVFDERGDFTPLVPPPGVPPTLACPS